MALPKLRMTQTDVKTALERAFRKNLNNLIFTPVTDVVKIDGTPIISLNREFDGIGQYNITIYSSLYVKLKENDFMFTDHYKMTTSIKVDCNVENEPIITFDSPVNIRKEFP